MLLPSVLPPENIRSCRGDTGHTVGTYLSSSVLPPRTTCNVALQPQLNLHWNSQADKSFELWRDETLHHHAGLAVATYLSASVLPPRTRCNIALQCHLKLQWSSPAEESFARWRDETLHHLAGPYWPHCLHLSCRLKTSAPAVSILATLLAHTCLLLSCRHTPSENICSCCVIGRQSSCILLALSLRSDATVNSLETSALVM